MRFPKMCLPATHAAAVAEATQPNEQFAGQQTDLFFGWLLGRLFGLAIAPHLDDVDLAMRIAAIAPSVAADG
ncbi:MAG: hypothetical protein SNJ57_02810 [Cyanobacteriota bacterium]